MPQQRYDITWYDPADEEAHTDFKLTPREILNLLRWGLAGNVINDEGVRIYSISECAE